MIMKTEEILTDQEVHDVAVNADFGEHTKREIINKAVLKCACGLYSGSTVTFILEQHGLIDSDNALTVKGKAYLWAVYKVVKT